VNSRRLITNPELCVGCNRCSLACSFKKEGEYSIARARIRVLRDLEHGLCQPLVCQHCEKPECLIACGLKAIKKSEDGLVSIDSSICVGCGSCKSVCPFGAVIIHPDRRIAAICDLCDGEPECIKYCVTKALQISNIGNALLSNDNESLKIARAEGK
jgi:Fe-S-cluster-containing hydrogenase component 2